MAGARAEAQGVDAELAQGRGWPGMRKPTPSLEMAILREADLVAQLLRGGRSALDRARVEDLIARFDARPFTAKCSKCRAPATFGTFYGSDWGLVRPPMFWCSEDHLRETSLAGGGKAIIVRSYRDVLGYVREHRKNSNPDYRAAIRFLAKAKGLPARLTEKAAQAFLG